MGIERIQTYNIGFYICMAIAIFGALLAVILFFSLDIREAWRMNTGKAKSDSIRSMKQNIPVKVPEKRRLNEAVFAEQMPGLRDTVVLFPTEIERPTEVLFSETNKASLGTVRGPDRAISFALTKNILLVHTNENI